MACIKKARRLNCSFSVATHHNDVKCFNEQQRGHGDGTAAPQPRHDSPVISKQESEGVIIEQ